MKNKKVIFIALIIVLICISGCSSLKNEVVDIDGLRVAYVVKQGGITDKSVGQLGYEGVLKAKNNLGIKEQVLEGDVNDPENLEKHLKEVAAKNDLIIMNGKDLSELSLEVSALFREKKIVVIGIRENETNIQDVNFKDEEAAFLMGIIAGRNTKANKVGLITYEKYEDTDRLLAGFIAGINTVNEEAAKGLLNDEYVTYVGRNATENEVKEIAEGYIADGVDIILEKLGVEELGVFKACQGTNTKVIGVGSDKYELYPEYKEIILSSIIKKVDEVTYEAIDQANSGQFKAGEQNSIIYGLESEKLDYAESTKNTVSTDVLAEVDKYKDMIKKYDIKVPQNRLEVLEFKVQ